MSIDAKTSYTIAEVRAGIKSLFETPGDAGEVSDLRADLMTGLRKLDKDDLTILLLFAGGKTYAEIVTKTELNTETAARSKLRRALIKLTEVLNGPTSLNRTQ